MLGRARKMCAPSPEVEQAARAMQKSTEMMLAVAKEIEAVAMQAQEWVDSATRIQRLKA